MAKKKCIEGREILDYKWCPSLEKGMQQYRSKLYRKVESNLPADAFADEAVTDDDIGTFYPRMTEVGNAWSTLGEHERTVAEEQQRNNRIPTVK